MKSTNIEVFPFMKRLRQVTEGTNVATRIVLRRLHKEVGQDPDNVVDLAAVRKEKLMNILGH